MAESYASSGSGCANASSHSLGPSVPSTGIPPVIRDKLTGSLGFANFLNQVHRKSVSTGFQFTAMVVGDSGLGKSTLINTMFNTSLYPPKRALPAAAERPKTVAIESIGADIEENGVRLHLTVVDTPGFGDFVNNDDSWKPIVDNIESRFDSYLEQENRVNRSKVVDNRVHACLYFIQPTGHSLKQIDIEFMRRLHTKVNLIPVIAKADTMTEEEVQEFKLRILSDITHHNIQIFQAPLYHNEDEETLADAEEIASKIPFAVVGSDKVVKTPDGRMVRGRSYPWGVVEVDDEDHCDFVNLRQILVRTYMEELKERTNDFFYENWRTERLLSMGVAQDSSVFKEINPAARLRQERILHEAKLMKMENEMKVILQQKVHEKEAKLKQSEEELYARHKKMKDALDKRRADLEDKRRRIESGKPLTPAKSSWLPVKNLSRWFSDHTSSIPDITKAEERQCRICLDGPEEEVELGRLIRPCLCKGSISFVHVKCLQRWRHTSTSPEAFYSCQQCHYHYYFARTTAFGIATNPVVVGALSAIFFSVIVLLSSFLTTRFMATTDEPHYSPFFILPSDVVKALVRATVRIFLGVDEDSLLSIKRLSLPMQLNNPSLGFLGGLVRRFVLGLPVVGAASLVHMLLSAPSLGHLHWLARQRGNRDRRNNSRDIAAIFIVLLIVVGILQAIYQVHKLTERMTKWLLLRAEDVILEVR